MREQPNILKSQINILSKTNPKSKEKPMFRLSLNQATIQMSRLDPNP